MASQSSTLEKYLVKLLDPSTSPENALEAMSFHCLTPEAYTSRDCEPQIIFFSYIKFIMTRHPDGRLEGIWQKIMNKAIRLTKFVPDGIPYSEEAQFLKYIDWFRRRYSPETFPWVVPELITQIDTWLTVALSDHSKCSNPYIRLEMIRLMSLVREYSEVGGKNDECFCEMFIHTICEICPHQLYLSENVVLLFGVYELKFALQSIEKIISSFISEDIIRARFLSQFIQRFQLLSDITGSYPVITLLYGDYISLSYYILKTIWNYFEHFVSEPLINHYLVEYMSEFTAAAINNKNIIPENHESFIYYRNQIASELKIATNLCDLPKLLLSRQVTGQPQAVRKHGLLLNELDPFYKIQDEPEDDSEEEHSATSYTYTSYSDSSSYTGSSD